MVRIRLSVRPLVIRLYHNASAGKGNVLTSTAMFQPELVLFERVIAEDTAAELVSATVQCAELDGTFSLPVKGATFDQEAVHDFVDANGRPNVVVERAVDNFELIADLATNAVSLPRVATLISDSPNEIAGLETEQLGIVVSPSISTRVVVETALAIEYLAPRPFAAPRIRPLVLAVIVVDMTTNNETVSIGRCTADTAGTVIVNLSEVNLGLVVDEKAVTL